MFVSAQAPAVLPGLVVLVLQVLVFGSAAAGLVATGHRTLATVFVVIIVTNAVLSMSGDSDLLLAGRPIHSSA